MLKATDGYPKRRAKDRRFGSMIHPATDLKSRPELVSGPIQITVLNPSPIKGKD